MFSSFLRTVKENNSSQNYGQFVHVLILKGQRQSQVTFKL